MTRPFSDLGDGYIQLAYIEGYEGAMTDVGPNETAFVHRR